MKTLNALTYLYLTFCLVFCDLTPPIKGTTQDGVGDKDLQFTSVQATYSTKWSGFSDPESDVVDYLLEVQRKSK